MENLTGTYNFSFDTTSPFRCESPNGYYFASPTVRLFGIPWILQYHPSWKDTNKGDIFLCLTDMPNNVASVKTRRMIQYNETGQVFEEIDTYDLEHRNWGSKQSNMVTRTDLKKLSGSMKLELLELKDSNGNSVYEQYVAARNNGGTGIVAPVRGAVPLQQPSVVSAAPSSSNEDKQLQKVMLESLSFQINKISEEVKLLNGSIQRIHLRMQQIEEKKADDNGLRKQIEDIRKSISRLQSGGGVKEDSDAEKFKKWLEETVKLGEYYELFVENGVENLTVLKMFGMEELSMIGIKKIGHRLQLSKAIETLKGQDGNATTAVAVSSAAAAPSAVVAAAPAAFEGPQNTPYV